jgi:hypothetical protein
VSQLYGRCGEKIIFLQKLINIEEGGNNLYYLEAEAVLSKLLRHS